MKKDRTLKPSIYRNGERIKYLMSEVEPDGYGFIRFYRWGVDTHGRECRVARHSVPEIAFKRGGTFRTEGATWAILYE